MASRWKASLPLTSRARKIADKRHAQYESTSDLIELEASLSKHLRGDVSCGRDQLIGTAAYVGDASVADESESEDFIT